MAFKPIEKTWYMIVASGTKEVVIKYAHENIDGLILSIYYDDSHLSDAICLGKICGIKPQMILPHPKEERSLEYFISAPHKCSDEQIEAIRQCQIFAKDAVSFVKNLQEESSNNMFNYDNIKCPEVHHPMTLATLDPAVF